MSLKHSFNLNKLFNQGFGIFYLNLDLSLRGGAPVALDVFLGNVVDRVHIEIKQCALAGELEQLIALTDSLNSR